MKTLRTAAAGLVFRALGFGAVRNLLHRVRPLRARIRDADAARDLEELASFGHTFSRRHAEEHRACLRRDLAALDPARDLLLVAVLDRCSRETVAGFVRLTLHGPEWWMMGLEVRPRYWRRGLAGQLSLAAIDRLAAAGAAGLNLSVRRDNTPAVNLYLKLGFVDAPFPGSPFVGPNDRGMRLRFFAGLKRPADSGSLADQPA